MSGEEGLHLRERTRHLQRLDTSRCEGTWDGPPGREAQGHGAWIVLVGVTPDQGGQEIWSQGEAKQVFGVFKREVSEMESAKTD